MSRPRWGSPGRVPRSGSSISQPRRTRAGGALFYAAHQPTATPSEALVLIEQLRRTHKWSASRIAFELAQAGTSICRRTVSRHLAELGINRRRFIDPNGEVNRQPRKIQARRPGHVIHVDVKKVGRIPDGGGWRVHGRGSDQAKAVNRRKKTGRGGYVYLHKVERYNRILAEGFLYARTWMSEAQRAYLLGRWIIHYNYHRPHTALGNQPPAARLPDGVTNVMASYI